MASQQPAPAPETKAECENSEELKAALRPELQLYYDIRDGSYVSALNGRFVGMNKADLQLRFKALGFPALPL